MFLLSKRPDRSFLLLLLLAGTLSVCGLFYATLILAAPSAPTTVDFTVVVSIDPVVPRIGQPTTVNISVFNRGNTGSGSALLYYYVDPPQPPTEDTPPSYFFPVSSIAAGGLPRRFTYSQTFTTQGCDHRIYLWIDRDDQVAESDETNNLVELPVCVDVACTVDGHESDNSCSTASWLSDDGSQNRTFCDADNLTEPDTDWVKFTGFAGVTYTLSTGNLGLHADPGLSLYTSCSAVPVPGQNGGLAFSAPANGVYYVKIEDETGFDGPLTEYDLSLNGESGATDDYEPDDRCSLARDIKTTGSRQSHLFQLPGDEDWIKFTIQAGESFALIADNTAPGVNPVITLFTSCQQPAVASSDTQVGAHRGPGAVRVEAATATGQVYYARIINGDAALFGSNAHYDVSVAASDCVSDNFEEDDNLGQAKGLAVDGTAQERNICPAGDQDWMKVSLEAGKVYVFYTDNLGFAADTELFLYDKNGNLIAANDDYGYTAASRITFEASADEEYFLKVLHHNPLATGVNTRYEMVAEVGLCTPDDLEGDTGNNGPGDASPLAPNGTPQPHTFCADPLAATLGDQDWMQLEMVAGGVYYIETADLGVNSDTVLELYDRDGLTLLATNDDNGPGRSAALVYTATVPGTYFVRAVPYNSNVSGAQSDYQVRAIANIPPTPTPTPTPSPTPSPTPTPLPTVDLSTVQTLILVNRERLRTLYSPNETASLMSKLFELADHERVQGAVIPLESDPAIAAAYARWTADTTTLADTDLANSVAAAIRNRVLAFLESSSSVKYVVIVGDDRIIPFRRVPEGILADQEEEYVADVTAGSTIAAALAENMILTDDYFSDRESSQWKGNDFYLPDLATGRLVETPAEIESFIDAFLASPVNQVQNVLVTAYDFVQDSANIIDLLYRTDNMATDTSLISPVWEGDLLRVKQLNGETRYDLQSINGHSTHISTGTPNLDDILASEITTGTIDLTGTLIYAVGCHAGLNDPGLLDLPQAYSQRQVNYVGNTGYGWGGSGIVYSETLMRNYTRELLRETTAEIGTALMAAKQQYWERAFTFNGYDAKVLMQSTLYGLPMAQITTGGSLSDEEEFPSANVNFQPPTSFGSGTFAYGLSGSFGAFGDNQNADGAFLDLDENVAFAAGAPIQPQFHADLSAPSVGDLRGVLFLGGVYSDVVDYDPVVARPHNEYVVDTSEPAFAASGWYPQTPFSLQSNNTISGTGDFLVLSLGQFDSGSGTQRLFNQMSFDTFYSDSVDQVAPEVRFIDGLLDPEKEKGFLKVEAVDESSVAKVVLAFTNDPVGGQGTWQSQELIYDPATAKWSGEMTATLSTHYFIQVMDRASNVTVDDNKGRYYTLQTPLPLASGAPLAKESRLFLPAVIRTP